MITDEAIEIIESIIVSNSLSTYQAINFKEGATEALTNPTLLKAQGLHTAEELNAAKPLIPPEKPLPVGEGCTCDMCEFIAAEKAMEELGVKQETEDELWEELRKVFREEDYTNDALLICKTKFKLTRK